MSFDPRQTTIVEVKAIERAIFWDNVQLYLKVLGIAGSILALVMWLIWEKLG